MRPPAYGEQGRAVYEWDKFLSECEEKMGGTRATFSPEEVDAISKVLNSPPGDVRRLTPTSCGKHGG